MDGKVLPVAPIIGANNAIKGICLITLYTVLYKCFVMIVFTTFYIDQFFKHQHLKKSNRQIGIF